jgi:glycosyltransferase involved in cell wall biosynthesis
MRVLHFILGKANKDRPNGVNQVIAGLAKYSSRLGAHVRVLGMAQSVEKQGEVIEREEFEVTAYSRPYGEFFRTLYASVKWADIVHLHGVFSPWNEVVGRLSGHLGRPYVVTLHNGLASKLMRKSRFRKRLFHSLTQRRLLERAACIHVLTEEEATDALTWFRPAHVCCIPNGVDLDDYPSREPHIRGMPGELVMGYIGRISAEKNLDTLCQAVASLRAHVECRLVLAGPDSHYARALVARYGVSGVSWIGPKYGAEKVKFIRSLDLFVHPSLCDVFSIAAMEVLAIGVPLLITRTANAAYFFDRKAFFMCEPTQFGLTRGLETAVARREEWPAYSARGRELVEDRFNWLAAARSLLPEYEAVLNRRRT